MDFQNQNINRNRLQVLGILGMAGAPWMLIDFIENGLYDRFKNTTASGIHNFLFITGCLCSMLGYYHFKATGTTKTGNGVMVVQLLLLSLTNCWNIYEIIDPDSQSPIFIGLGMLWPISCLFLIVTGIFIIKAKRIRGWQAYTTLLAGLWFPFMMLIAQFYKTSLTALILAGAYAAIFFLALGFGLVTLAIEPKHRRFQK